MALAWQRRRRAPFVEAAACRWRLALAGALLLLLPMAFANLADAADKPTATAAKPRTVLVLGSGGVVGSALAAELRKRGNTVLEVRNRVDVDLRVNNSLSAFDSYTIDFCFYVACEVGGSKFLASGAVQEAVWEYNVLMYNNVLPYLRRRNIPHLFTSSQLKSQPTAYGRVKTLGEELVAESPLGRSIRFWNVYGPERIGIKSHVMNDWLYQCVKHGRVDALSDGNEQRQLSHTDDVAVTLSDAMLVFQDLPQVSAVTNGRWQSMREVAGIISSMMQCEFRFSTKQSSTMKGMDPTQINILHVNSTLEDRLPGMIEHSKRLVVDEVTWQTRDPYVSIVVAVSQGDDLEGVPAPASDGSAAAAAAHGSRGRTFNFLRSIVITADVAHLDYELVVVQYNPSSVTGDYTTSAQYKAGHTDADLPWGQLFPWTSRHSFGRLRVVTVPPAHHKWASQGGHWEYLARNVGAQRARGKYVLFTSPDDVFPPGLFGMIAKQGLLPGGIVYRAGMFLGSPPAPAGKEPVEACQDIAATARFCYKEGLWCAKETSGPLKREDYVAGSVGDFELWYRKDFISSNGYAEVPQNSNLDVAHLEWSMEHLKLQERWFDEFTCHQAHGPQPDVKSPLALPALIKLHDARPAAEVTGLSGEELPEARMYDMLTAAYNPETPFTTYAHDPLFQFWGSSLQSAPYDPKYVLDFLGIRTAYEYDCGAAGAPGRFRTTHLSRRIPCDRHDEFGRQGYEGPIMGDLPVIDEEYMEWRVVLRAAVAASHAPITEPFVAVELGARYGAWAVRDGMAMRRLQPERRVQLLAVEADQAKYAWLVDHVAVNGLANETRALLGYVGLASGGVEDKGEAAADVGDRVQLMELLSQYVTINILHCDLQDEEAIFLDDSFIQFAAGRIKAIHFGTHRRELHNKLKAAFGPQQGWRVLEDMVHSVEQAAATAFGPVRVPREGILSVENTRFLPHPTA